MKPDWDKLIEDYEGSKTILIADVDCTASGKTLCNSVGIRRYPTIKYGDANDLQDYNGARSFSELKKHAETLVSVCGPGNLDLCDAEEKMQIAEFQAIGADKREAMIKEKESEGEKIESDYTKFIDDITEAHTEASEKKEEALKAIRKELGLVKSVHSFARESMSDL